jgi:uncharacterized protein (DUF4415 family)
MSESKSATVRFAVDPQNPVPAGQRQALARRVKAADARPVDYSDIPELPDEWFLRAAREGQLAIIPAKKPVSVKLDEDVLDFFKGRGGRYQTHINQVLRAYMLAHRIQKA